MDHADHVGLIRAGVEGAGAPGVWADIGAGTGAFMDGALHADVGRGTVVELPPAETERRWQATTPQWPIMHAVLHGVTRDQMMARHRANHIQVAYGPDAVAADAALQAKAAMLHAMGIRVHLCGTVKVG
jgi:hypothetical protein